MSPDVVAAGNRILETTDDVDAVVSKINGLRTTVASEEAQMKDAIELRNNSKARESVDKEWNKLIDAGTWDYDSVREWEDVANEARALGQTVHVGDIFEICVEKGSELPAGDPARKFKGRCVFQGNRVTDQDYRHALFSDLGSAPATMQAAKVCDFIGLLPGNITMQCDAEQAYTQSDLGGDIKTWVEIPEDRWPKDGAFEKKGLVKGKHKAVCQMKKSLYGHLDS